MSFLTANDQSRFDNPTFWYFFHFSGRNNSHRRSIINISVYNLRVFSAHWRDNIVLKFLHIDVKSFLSFILRRAMSPTFAWLELVKAQHRIITSWKLIIFDGNDRNDIFSVLKTFQRINSKSLFKLLEIALGYQLTALAVFEF
jgi:hypothetical protein